MLLNAYCSPIRSPDPKTFAGLMDLYEVNYIRFRQLCPGLDGISETQISTVEGALNLHLSVLERCKYTTTVSLTYLFQEVQGTIKPEPNLTVRIYHDARQAEVLSRAYRCLGREVRIRDLHDGSELKWRWSMNRFLYKWLGYCCHQGHFFPIQNALHTSVTAEKTS